MRQSELFTKTRKEIPKDEDSINAQLLIRAGFVDKVMAGVYTFLPLGLRVFKKIENIIREEMIAIGGQEILMPSLQPKENWEKTGRWEGLDNLFRFTSHYSKIDYALGATHEEIVVPLTKKFVFSYKDLPIYVFQIQNKFRDEKRVKSGLLRGREFFMKDFYSFHKDEEDLDQFYFKKGKKAYENVFKRTGIGNSTYFTFASGGTFSKYSHEFQTISSAGEDTIFLCEKCKIAVNKEIILEQSSCPSCGNKNLKEEKAVEVGNIFQLKTKYSIPFDLKYRDQNGAEKDVIMGCYGIGLNRLMGAIVEIHHDKNGIIWPQAVAPFKAHLLNLSKDKKNKDFAEKIYKDLQISEVEVLFDDRVDVTPGEKFAEADLMGIPYRLVISDKTGSKIEIKRRDGKITSLVSKKDLITKLSK
ncbi:MAG: His/Gly/Thr/Pro-type tRNA ligase C-terminal domain-containing protein [Candidatus Wolfebacteria bacterium]|nr:His/Gly/Thr/Pro-type tRNA ligase C-terminal domain-containing protein [Candidatus Wolfebacteria bacterium]